ncbi:MAG: flagellar protein FlaG [Candidatus Sericytochromatia bacterium]|nr:flagellar protein FlaG [Candidatus Tanganyikabacteria bacterium]
MKIEGTLAVSAAVSNQALATEGQAVQRERTNVENARIQTASNPDANAVAGAQRAVGAKMLSTAVESVERMLGEMDENLRLRIRRDGRRLVVVVYNSKTGETMREIPADRFIDMMDTFEKQISGLFVDERQ